MCIVTAEERARRFTDKLVKKLGDAVQCVVLAGSHARGDATPKSDIDLWVFLSQVTSEALRVVGTVVTTMGGGHEINPQCLTFAEASGPGFRKGFSTVQMHLDGIVLYGQLLLPKPTREDIRQDAAELAVFSLMSARHYITVNEPEEALARKLDRFLLKPLVWAIRSNVLLHTGKYHKSIEALLAATPDPDAKSLVSIYQQCRSSQYSGPCMPVIHTAASVCSRIIADRA
jgi:hypothetical protein